MKTIEVEDAELVFIFQALSGLSYEVVHRYGDDSFKELLSKFKYKAK